MEEQVPKQIPKFMFWDLDVAMVAIVGIGVAILLGYALIGSVLSIGAGWAYAYWKKAAKREHE
jgi:multisubunit Na+/H+ antiporter MnhB subunit